MFLFLISAIEGLTEFLPISSTAHMLFVADIFKIHLTTEYLTSVQLGAICAIFFAFPKVIYEIIQDIIGLKFNITRSLVLITLPAIFFGFILHFFYDPVFSSLFTSLVLIVGGVIMLKLPTPTSNITLSTLTHKQALTIGLFQVLAFIPGTSRSLSVILGCLFFKIPRPEALKISVISGFPIIFSATVLEIYSTPSALFIAIPHMVTAFIFAFIGISVAKFLTKYNLNLLVFGYYRIIIGILALFVI